jgi:hypothetical protein
VSCPSPPEFKSLNDSLAGDLHSYTTRRQRRRNSVGGRLQEAVVLAVSALMK